MTEVRYSLREIQCDMPGCDSAFEIGLGASWVEVRRSAKSCGWVRVPSGGDLCPDHAKVDRLREAMGNDGVAGRTESS